MGIIMLQAQDYEMIHIHSDTCTYMYVYSMYI